MPYRAKQRNRVFAEKDVEITISGQFYGKKGAQRRKSGNGNIKVLFSTTRITRSLRESGPGLIGTASTELEVQGAGVGKLLPLHFAKHLLRVSSGDLLKIEEITELFLVYTSYCRHFTSFFDKIGNRLAQKNQVIIGIPRSPG